MQIIDQQYINGRLVKSAGRHKVEIINPANGEIIGESVLGNEQDVLMAIAAAKEAFPAFAASTVAERQEYLQQLHDAIIERIDELKKATILEYGATVQRAEWSNRYAAEIFLQFKDLLSDYNFERSIGQSQLVMTPLGVTAIMTAWNSNSGSICVKLAAAIAAGCTTVIKPSEFSCLQSKILTEAFDAAALPAGVINVVNGYGDVMGSVLSTHQDIAKICFTGSSVVGKIIAKNAVDTMKRLTLELSGKSPNIILDDADLDKAVTLAINACFQNSGQACVAGSRLLVPEHLLERVKPLLKEKVAGLKVGLPTDPETYIGPMASQKQYDRIQHYIQSGIASGAEVLVGGTGKPEGLENGFFVKPTVFINSTADMPIVKEEIFGPVLSVLTYETEEAAIAMANDTVYGLQAYISSSDIERARKMAKQINAGRVLINTLWHDADTPFGGFKQSGIGREGGIFGLEAQLEPKVIVKEVIP
ncbi:aldehyde dehydrogenase family protein [Pedobacter zeae]|uniref:aldehyde dehydrogenase (NAD(+)) n=1 Tax=Pedobacter zeae TaxID=1737356 RepID=A0A7W6K7U3_9SPHI|nr:aldehyde dehydrogenase family protein [Pedobacter zeae]MBB4106720.1 aldehyde dehydrogenase (NAD+) [Pedobacter zeae]GGH03345.1 aldehyde dehydrogenase [Pedobacter zeae]